MHLRFRFACLLLTIIALIGSAAGKLSNSESKSLKTVQDALAKVKTWDTFNASSYYKDTRTFVQDFLLPVTNVILEENKVVFQKSKDGKYKSHTDIARVDDFQVPLIGYKSEVLWHYEWVRTEKDKFFLKIDHMPKTSSFAKTYSIMFGRWLEGDDQLRAGYHNLFTDHIKAGMESATFLEEDAVESVEDMGEDDVHGQKVMCYKITPSKKATILSNEAIAEGLVHAEQMEALESAGFAAANVGSDKELKAAAEEEEAATPNRSTAKTYTACVSKGGDGNLVSLGETSKFGPVSGRAGGHYYIHMISTREALRIYSGVNKPVKFPDTDTPEQAGSPPGPTTAATTKFT